MSITNEWINIEIIMLPFINFIFNVVKSIVTWFNFVFCFFFCLPSNHIPLCIKILLICGVACKVFRFLVNRFNWFRMRIACLMSPPVQYPWNSYWRAIFCRIWFSIRFIHSNKIGEKTLLTNLSTISFVDKSIFL